MIRITKDAVEALFRVGDEVYSGGRRKKFKITKISEDRIGIIPTEAKTPSRLSYEKLSVVINNYHLVDASRIEDSVGRLLAQENLSDTQNESYLYGFAREFLERGSGRGNAFIEIVARSASDSPNARRERLEKAQKTPSKALVNTWAFIRNPDVVAEVLSRAKGKCEICCAPAPFLRKSDGTPYLEVHHKIPLAEGGEDTVENAIGLCPNCHREQHYG